MNLKKLRSMADSLGMLDNDAQEAGVGAVGDLDPVARLSGLGREVDAEGGDRVAERILVELGDEQIVVLHAQRELLHVDEVEDAVLAAEEQERAGRVEGRDGRDVLRLPLLRQRVPHAYLAHIARRHQRRTDEEERVDGRAQAEVADQMRDGGVHDQPQADRRLERDGDESAGTRAAIAANHTVTHHLLLLLLLL